MRLKSSPTVIFYAFLQKRLKDKVFRYKIELLTMSNGKKNTSAQSTTAAPAPKAASKKTTPKEEKKEQPAPAVATKKAPSKKVEVAAPVAEVPAAEAKTKRKVSKETVIEDFTSLIDKITEEITKRRPAKEEGEEAATKKKRSKKDAGVPVKFLSSIKKKLEALKNDACYKMLKVKRASTRDNSKSGLMKPVNISGALYTFLKGAGFEVDKNGKYPRVDITRNIHAYVKNNKLRKGDRHTDAEIAANPTLKDRRIILPDDKLAKLLGYDTTSADPLTYFRLPQYLKTHFIN